MGQPQSRPPPPPPPGIELRCIVVNTGSKVSVTIDQSSKGQELKFALKEQASLDCAAIDLELFIAKRSDGSWVAVTKEHRRQMKAGYVPYEIFKTMTEDNMVNPWSRLSDFTLPSADQLQKDEYQILIQKPGRLGVEPIWKIEESSMSGLDTDVIHFVKRQEAVKELQSMYNSSHGAHQKKGRPRRREVPFSDCMSGLGKTIFASNYIKWCREMWPVESTRNPFQRELCACHTIFLSPPSPELLRGPVSAPLVITSLVQAINNELEPDTTLDVTASSAMDLASLTKSLVKKLGPLFIVFDDIGRWFMSPGFKPPATTTELSLFHAFCRDVLQLWMEIPRVYLLVLGETALLRNVHERVLMINGSPSSFVFKRLPLYLLRPHEIEEILRKTQARSCSGKTVSDEWKLATEEDVTEAATLLHHRSSGDPRVILGLLIACKTYEALEMAPWRALELTRLEMVRHDSSSHKNYLDDLLCKEETVDLTAEVEDGENGGLVVVAQLLTRCFISWQGPLQRAKVYALPEIKHELANMVYPLRDYVRHVASALKHVSPNHPDVWEWICIKRFGLTGIPGPQGPGVAATRRVASGPPQARYLQFAVVGMKKSAARDAVREAIALRKFPPALELPESNKNGLLSTWLTYPTFTWAPESLSDTRKASCIVKGCTCTPSVKEYTSRMVDDIDHKTILYYARYSCTGKSKGTSFSTVDDLYISSTKAILLSFPYLLTYKGGISKDMFDLLYDSMLTTRGISGCTSSVTRRRQKRYYRIKALASVAVEAAKQANAELSPPLLPTIEEHMACNTCVDEETLQGVWLSQTEVCSRLLGAQIAQAKCNRVFRIDHSQKFCSKLKIFGSDGKKEQSPNVRMLLLVQNEIGQIVARGLTRSENHEESAAILKSVVPMVDTSATPPPVCVCDDANKTRSMIAKVFGDVVETKQDPFHVIQRFTEKLADKAERKSLAKKLSMALYDVGGEIRSPETMAERFQEVLRSVKKSSVRVDQSTWENCIEVNLEQIRNRDLYVEENEYLERGEKIRVVSTSQLEAVHSKLRKLLDRVVSIEVGMRILDIFLLKHNLKTGAKYKRNPAFAEFDFVTLCQTAVFCRGVLPDSPQIEFIYQLLSFNPPSSSIQQHFRPGGISMPAIRPWERLYNALSLSTTEMEAKMLRKHSPAVDIRQLFTSAHVKRKTVSQQSFVEQLGLEPEYETTSEFSSNEFSLLEEIRGEQLALDKKQFWWSDCTAVTTILYNAFVQKVDNPSLKLRKRCFSTVDRYLVAIDAALKTRKQKSAASVSILNFNEELKVNDALNSEDDVWLQRKLYKLLREKGAVKKRTQVFCNAYDLAACICPTITTRKSKEWLIRRWNALRKTGSRRERKKEGEIDLLAVPVEVQYAASPDQLLQLTPTAAESRLSTPASEPPASHIPAACSVNTGDPTSTSSSEQAFHAVEPTSAHPAFARSSSDPANNAAAPSTPNPPLNLYSDGGCEVIDDETMTILKEVAAAIPKGAKGKWIKVWQEYAKRNPATRLQPEHLRGRLKPKRQRGASVSTTTQHKALVSSDVRPQDRVDLRREPDEMPPSISSTKPEKKKARTACQSCHSLRRRCGSDGDNANCEFKRQVSQTITSFFAASSSAL